MYIYSWVSVHVMYQPKTEAHVILNLKKLGGQKRLSLQRLQMFLGESQKHF